MGYVLLVMPETFAGFERQLREHVASMIEGVNTLFTVDLDKDALWKLYLDSFPAGANEIFRTRQENDCSACRHFIKAFGNVVSIRGGKVCSIWDFEAGPKYGPSALALSEFVKSRPITDIFVTDSLHIGVEKNFEKSENGVLTWEHLCIQLPDRFKTASRQTLDTVRGRARDLKTVFKRSLDEISEDAVASVLELIAQNSLYKGEEWKTVLEAFQKHQRAWACMCLDATAQDIYAWEQSIIAGPVIGKIRNHSIGVLLVDISTGMELDEAVRRYEKIVAPSNYKRPKAIFTAKMLADAERNITELGYMESLGRRHAALDDITVNNILFANRDVIQKLGGNVFAEMAKETGISPKQFDRIEEVPISVFVAEILPTARNIDVLLENRHQCNLVSLIAPMNSDAPSMFKWPNGFSWAYAGNIADAMKQRVKEAGGNVEGVLRFSIQWGPENENDFDAHCIEPNGNEIYFGRKRNHPSTGELDVDIIHPKTQTKDGIAVENITWQDISKMRYGTYQFFVHNYSHNGGRAGFTAEIEFDGQIHQFAYNKELRQGERVPVAEIIYSRDGFKIIEKIPSSMASRKLWSLDTNQFHPVSVIMMSPNYWDGQDGIGNRHFFFMLKGCQNQESPNGFFNEYLKNELLEHKRVFEALGGKMRVAPSEEQLSGVGFSSTQRNSLVVRVTGHVNRIVKVVF